MEHVDVCITHAGHGTLSTALLYGVPLVMLPNAADQPVLTGVVSRHGAGVALDGDTASSADYTAAVDRCLHEPSIKANASRLQQRNNEQRAVATLLTL